MREEVIYLLVAEIPPGAAKGVAAQVFEEPFSREGKCMDQVD